MKTGFKDPIAPKIKKEIKKDLWNFNAPQRDESTSCFINAGTHYGVGHKQPVGHEGNPKSKVEVLPFGRVKTLNLYADGKTHEIQED